MRKSVSEPVRYQIRCSKFEHCTNEECATFYSSAIGLKPLKLQSTASSPGCAALTSDSLSYGV